MDGHLTEEETRRATKHGRRCSASSALRERENKSPGRGPAHLPGRLLRHSDDPHPGEGAETAHSVATGRSGKRRSPSAIGLGGAFGTENQL